MELTKIFNFKVDTWFFLGFSPWDLHYFCQFDVHQIAASFVINFFTSIVNKYCQITVYYQTAIILLPDCYQIASKFLPDCYQISTRSLPDRYQISTRIVTKLLPNFCQIATRLLPDRYQIASNFFQIATRSLPDCY